MSVIIKGMEMPKEGVYHAVITFDGDSLGVRIPPSKEPFFLGRIVHIPTPHGRLIDADAYQYSGDLIDEPTIIEAEVSE